MNGVRIGIIASLLLCIWLAWPKGESNTPPRPLMIKSALKDAKDPIIVLGDSIVRQAAKAALASEHPVRVVDGDRVIGIVDDDAILRAVVAEEEAHQ